MKNHQVFYSNRYTTWDERCTSNWMEEKDVLSFLKHITSQRYPVVNIKVTKTINVTEKFEELIRGEANG